MSGTLQAATARVMKPRFPMRGASEFCQWCGIVVCRKLTNGEATYLRRGAGVLETVECKAPFTIHVLIEGRREHISSYSCWACSDDCEAKLLALNGLDPSLAGFVGEGAPEDLTPDLIIGDIHHAEPTRDEP